MKKFSCNNYIDVSNHVTFWLVSLNYFDEDFMASVYTDLHVFAKSLKFASINFHEPNKFGILTVLSQI